MIMKRRIYADHAATTKLSEKAMEAMLPFMRDTYQNPSTLYSSGMQVKRYIAEARENIADIIGAKPNEIFFTSGGTEADNWAIKGATMPFIASKQLVTSEIEHHAVLNSCEAFKHNGGEVKYLKPDRFGVISETSLTEAVEKPTSLVSIMLVNNEIGSIQNIRRLANITHNKGIPFHTDAVQAVGHIPVNVDDLQVDMLSASAHKFNGPKGIGFLYIRERTDLSSYIDGGAQEYGRRAGTENVSGIVGMAVALRENAENIMGNMEYLSKLREVFLSGLKECSVDYFINGSDNHLPGNISMSFRNLDGETILHRMDLKGIEIATGSACDSKDTHISHVIRSIGVPMDYAKGTVRISFGMDNTEEEASLVASQLVQIVNSMNESR